MASQTAVDYTTTELEGLLEGFDPRKAAGFVPVRAIRQLIAVMRERDTYRAGFAESIKICNDYAVHLHTHGGSLKAIPECVAAQTLLDSHLRTP